MDNKARHSFVDALSEDEWWEVVAMIAKKRTTPPEAASTESRKRASPKRDATKLSSRVLDTTKKHPKGISPPEVLIELKAGKIHYPSDTEGKIRKVFTRNTMTYQSCGPDRWLYRGDITEAA